MKSRKYFDNICYEFNANLKEWRLLKTEVCVGNFDKLDILSVFWHYKEFLLYFWNQKVLYLNLSV